MPKISALAAPQVIGMGASPGSTGAINVDAASYSTVAYSAVNSTRAFRVVVDTSRAYIGTSSNHAMDIETNGTSRWRVNTTAAVSQLVAIQVTAQIVGGSTNGLAIRNSGDTRDNFSVNDAGTLAILNDGTHSSTIASGGASGELAAGTRFTSRTTTSNVFLIGDVLAGTAGIKAGLAYYNGTQYYSALEVANVASGFGTLALMKSGGYIAEYGSTTGGGAAASNVRFRKTVTGISNAAATATFTITVPNAQHRASVRIKFLGALGAGGAIGAGEATAAIAYDIGIVRTAGVNAVGTVSTAYGSAAAAVAGAATVTTTAALSAVSGAVGATNTFTVNVTITRSGGSSDNHTCECYAEVLNSQATGITIS